MPSSVARRALRGTTRAPAEPSLVAPPTDRPAAPAGLSASAVATPAATTAATRRRGASAASAASTAGAAGAAAPPAASTATTRPRAAGTATKAGAATAAATPKPTAATAARAATARTAAPAATAGTGPQPTTAATPAGRKAAARKAAAALLGPASPPVELTWVNDSGPGIRRHKRGDRFVYLDVDGRPVRDEQVLQRIRKLAIPPAYREVWISADPNSHLQATGLDARGRKQYRYHAQWHAERGQHKFDRLRDFGRVLPRIRDRVQRQLAGEDAPTRTRVLATLVRLLDTTWLRIGNDEYARSNRSFGLSTLRNRHAGVHGAELSLSFVGKSGVRHEVKLEDHRVARVVRRCRELPGQELFQYIDADGSVHRVGSSDVNAWLADAAGSRVTAKDFRTWHGSVKALELTLAACAMDPAEATPAPAAAAAAAAAAARSDDGVAAAQPVGGAASAGPAGAAAAGPAGRSAAARKAAAAVAAPPPLPPRTPKAVLEAVARRLGNTPAVCRKAYIHPAVLALGDALADQAARAELLGRRWARLAPPLRGLSVAERRLMGLLSERRRRAA